MRSPRIDPTKCFDRVRYQPRRSVKRCDARQEPSWNRFSREIASLDNVSLVVRECIDRPCSEPFNRDRRARLGRCNTRRLSVRLSALRLSPLAERTREKSSGDKSSMRHRYFPALTFFACRTLIRDCVIIPRSMGVD